MGTNGAKLRLITMRSTHVLLVSIVLVLTGCAAPKSAPIVEPSPQPSAEPAASPQLETAAPPMPPVSADPYAVQTGRRLLDEAYPPVWLEGPQPVFAQQMTYAEAHKWLPMLSQEGDQVWGKETPVWLVIFKGRWQLLPYGQSQGTPAPTVYDGCLMVLFRAADGKLIANGDSLCPGQQ